jgi:epoxyqueuosine reductase QueG
MKSDEIKAIVIEHGADICGIAPAERFTGAPEGFLPTDVYDKCKSVIAFAKRVPLGANEAQSPIPYSYVNLMITQQVDNLTLNLCKYFEKLNINVVPIPSDDPYEYWLDDQQYGRGILSLRHAGYFAGLGVLGKNTLLINEKFGNMMQVGAILTDLELDGDPIADYEGCLADCTICLDICPVQALDEETVNQKLCRPLSNFKTKKGYTIKKCNLCRIMCPTCTGIN